MALDNIQGFDIKLSFKRTEKFMSSDAIKFAESIIKTISTLKIGDITQNNLDQLIISNLLSKLRNIQGMDEIEITQNRIPFLEINFNKVYSIRFFTDHIHFVWNKRKKLDQLEVELLYSVEKRIISIISVLIGSEIIQPEVELIVSLENEVKDVSVKKIEPYFTIERVSENLSKMRTAFVLNLPNEIELQVVSKYFDFEKYQTDLLLTITKSVQVHELSKFDLKTIFTILHDTIGGKFNE